MKKIISTCAAVCLVTTIFAQNLKNNMDSISYSLGVLFAQNFKTGEKIDINADAMAKGFKEALASTETIKSEAAQKIFGDYMANLSKAKYAGALESGTKFLAENGKRPSVTTTASGLQYEIMVAGTGAKPKATDKVTTHDHGTLLDGSVFDSSVQRGQPIDFPCNGVIQGWQEALQLMPMGSKWKLFVPYNLAYGEKGAGGSIGPYQTLIFEVELIKIN